MLITLLHPQILMATQGLFVHQHGFQLRKIVSGAIENGEAMGIQIPPVDAAGLGNPGRGALPDLASTARTESRQAGCALFHRDVTEAEQSPSARWQRRATATAVAYACGDVFVRFHSGQSPVPLLVIRINTLLILGHPHNLGSDPTNRRQSAAGQSLQRQVTEIGSTTV